VQALTKSAGCPAVCVPFLQCVQHHSVGREVTLKRLGGGGGGEGGSTQDSCCQVDAHSTGLNRQQQHALSSSASTLSAVCIDSTCCLMCQLSVVC
jgi:hypothetical protein